ncbi:MAG: leucine--tRNA ligase [Planctomycetota bacterium]
MTDAYTPFEITRRWQQRWEEVQAFVARPEPGKPTYHCYEYLPFPSGSLHMGHVRNYVIGDTLSRFHRLKGYSVLYAQAFDSMGLPVEDAAIRMGCSPAEWIERCCAKMKPALLALGLSYDPERFFSLDDPSYYRWTQWIFLKLYEAGRIYRSDAWIDHCDRCQSAVPPEQLLDGRCWRCGDEVVPRQQPQWYIDLQSVAQDLLDGLETVSFPDQAKVAQQNWIGRKEGVAVAFEVEGRSEPLEVFTHRLALLPGATFVGLAPEHPLVPALLEQSDDPARSLEEVQALCAVHRVDRMRTPERAGVDTGARARNPLSGELLPVYVAPYVQVEFGGGAVVGCPAHSSSDARFARTMGLPARTVIAPDGEPSGSGEAEPYLGEGTMVGSGRYDGQRSEEVGEALLRDLGEAGRARTAVSYEVRDWCISRQRYWSVPIPIVYCDTCGTVPVPEDQLPVVLPVEGIELGGDGNPLDRTPDFVNCSCPRCGGAAKRETSTLDTFVNSAWVILRFCNPDFSEALFDPDAVAAWSPGDLVVGGAEHVTVGNFYFRAIFRLLHSEGLIPQAEPWRDTFFHGMVLLDGRKMSKSIGNIVEPQDVIDQYGVDAVRFQSMAASRLVRDVNWSEGKMASTSRDLMRIWRLALEIIEGAGPDEHELDEDALSSMEQKFRGFVDASVAKVERNYDALEIQAACNNVMALAEKMKSFLKKTKGKPSIARWELLRMALRRLLVLLNPVAPHLTEELWERLGNREMLCQGAHWPTLMPVSETR